MHPDSPCPCSGDGQRDSLLLPHAPRSWRKEGLEDRVHMRKKVRRADGGSWVGSVHTLRAWTKWRLRCISSSSNVMCAGSTSSSSEGEGEVLREGEWGVAVAGRRGDTLPGAGAVAVPMVGATPGRQASENSSHNRNKGGETTEDC